MFVTLILALIAVSVIAYKFHTQCSHVWDVIDEDVRDWARRGTNIIVGTTVTRTLRCTKCGEIKSNTTDIGITP